MIGKSFDITFKGIEYSIDVLKSKGQTSIYVEHANIDDDVEDDELLSLTQYLIEEGFVEAKNIE